MNVSAASPTPPAGMPAPDALRAVLDLDGLQQRLPALQRSFASAAPFPHVVLDGLLRRDVVGDVAAAFPSPDAGLWTHYRHLNERKLGSPARDAYPAAVARAVAALQTPEFVAWLSELSGIPGLFADPTLEGAGMHMSLRGGFLNVHTDFQRHHHHRDWRRTVNLILFLNPDWDERWGGHIELWDPAMQGCVSRVAPVANRAVIFRSDHQSFHGHPEPLACPPDRARKSLALYYYTRVQDPPQHEYSRFAARPGDSRLRRLGMRLDNDLVRAFSFLKRRGAARDRDASRLLRAIARLRGTLDAD